MNYKHIILLTSALFLASAPAIGRQLSEDEAKAAALSFISKNSPKFNKAPGKGRVLKMAYKAERKAENAFFVFNQGENDGFMIVSADDRLPQILGYASAGNFDYASAPENLKWWLSQYEDEIFQFYSQETTISPLASNTDSEADSKAEIPALISTTWNQDALTTTIVLPTTAAVV